MESSQPAIAIPRQPSKWPAHRIRYNVVLGLNILTSLAEKKKTWQQQTRPNLSGPIICINS